MRHRLFAVASAISLLFCLATTAMWVRSHWKGDAVGYVGHYRWYTKSDRLTTIVSTYPGIVWLQIDDQVVVGGVTHGFFCDTGPAQPLPHILRLTPPKFAGFDYDVGEPLWLIVPFWMFAVVTSLAPLIWLSRWAARRTISLHRVRNRCCPTCGYNLTGNITGVCSECGAPIPKESADKSPRPP